MILRVNGERAELESPEDLSALRVVTSLEESELARAVAGLRLGVVEGGYVFLAPEALVALMPRPDRSWVEGVDSMFAYARSRGWSDPTGRIRAHVEWVAADG